MYDVAIIGLGITGLSLARELSRYDISVIGIEAAHDFAMGGATKANSGIVHAGYDAKYGTKKAYFNVKGNALYKQWSEELEFDYINNGSLIALHEGTDKQGLFELMENGNKNGVSGLRIVEKDELHEMEKNLKSSVIAALFAPSGGITCPYGFAYACAENARQNGVEYALNSKVLSVSKCEKSFTLHTSSGDICAKVAINCAGLYADKVNDMFGGEPFKILPRKGQYILFDKSTGANFDRTIFGLPTKMGKGILISRTVDGNLYLGPTSEDISDTEDTATTAEGREDIIKKALMTWSDIPFAKVISGFSGIRAHTDVNDFIIGKSEIVQNYFLAAGIESPGLTSAPAIATKLSEQIAVHLKRGKNKNFCAKRPAIPKFSEMSAGQKCDIIAKNPSYARVICRCETITQGEILQAIDRGATTIDGVKRRVRAGMGKCQGGFCAPEILMMLSEKLGVSPLEITKQGEGSNMLFARIK